MVSIIKLFFDLIEVIVKGFIELLGEVMTTLIPTTKKEIYDAHFLKASDILFKNNDGFFVDGLHCLGESSFKHMVAFGSSGAGKTSSLIIPFCLQVASNSSLVIIDVSGEICKITGASFRKRGFRVKVWGLQDSSEGYNSLERCKTDSEIDAVSHTLIANTIGFNGSDNYWAIAAKEFLSTFIKIVIKILPLEQRNLSCVYQLITVFASEPEKIDRLIGICNDPKIILQYKSYVAMDSKLLMSILSTAKTALYVFSLEEVALSTSFDTIGNFDELRRIPTVIFLTTSIPRLKLHAPATALFIEQLLSHLMERIPDKGELPCYLVLDEIGNYYIHSLPTAVSVLRKNRVGILQIYQHSSQLKQYKDLAKSIEANAYCKIYLTEGGLHLEDAEKLSRACGQFEFFDDNIRRIMPLASVESLMQMNEALIFVGSNPPIKTTMKPYYKNKRLLKLTQNASFIPENKIPYITAPIICLDNL